MWDFLQYGFMQRALIAGALMGVLLAVLGVFVTLRRMSFFADGMAHASLVGVAVGILLAVNPLPMAILASIIFASLIYFLEKRMKLTSDTAIGIIFTAGISLGVILLSFKSGYQPDLMSFLFGNILAVRPEELWIIGIFGALILLVVRWQLRNLILLSLDEETAYVAGVKTGVLQFVFYNLLAVSVVLGIKVLGVLLVSALLIIPVATAKIFAKSFKSLVIYSVIWAELAVIGGVLLSYFLDLPTGPTIVLLGTVVLGVIYLCGAGRQN